MTRTSDPELQKPVEKVRYILAAMKDIKMNLTDLLFWSTYGDKDCISDSTIQAARTGLFHSARFPVMLENWFNPPDRTSNYTIGARPALIKLAVKWLDEIVKDELKKISDHLKTKQTLTEDDLLAISIADIEKICGLHAPRLCLMLRNFATTPKQRDESLKNPTRFVIVIICMLAYHRTGTNNRLQQLLSLYWTACGVPSKPTYLLHSFGLGMSPSWTWNAIERLSQDAMARVTSWVQDQPFAAMHDNINIARKVSSQRVDNHNQFDCGTAMTILPLPAKVASVLENAERRISKDHWTRRSEIPTITYKQLRLKAKDTFGPVKEMFIYHIRQFLLDHPRMKDFKERINSPLLAPPTPVDELTCDPTVHWPLRTAYIDEATYEGTSSVIEDLLKQIGLDSSEASQRLGTHRLVPWIGDQKTVSLMRGLAGMRGCDVNGLERLDWCLFLKGWFHEMMALQNQILWIHGGTVGGSGLKRDIAKLARISLSLKTRQQKADFHHLHELICHVLHAHILDCWKEIAGANDLDSLITKISTWTAEDIAKGAHKIYDTFIQQGPAKEGRPGDQGVPADIAWTNASLFMRDALVYWELAQAIKHGDVGRMGNLTPTLLFMFVGGSNHKYTIELLEELQMELNELTPDEVQVVRHHCWLANTKGKRNTFFPMDQLQEHNIRAIKHIYKPQGPNISWDFIARISPIVPLLSKTQFHIEKNFETGIKGRRHENVDPTTDIDTLFATYHEERLHKKDLTRISANPLSTDVIREGLSTLIHGKTLVDWKEGREKYLHSFSQVWNQDRDEQTDANDVGGTNGNGENGSDGLEEDGGVQDSDSDGNWDMEGDSDSGDWVDPVDPSTRSSILSCTQ